MKPFICKKLHLDSMPFKMVLWEITQRFRWFSNLIWTIFQLAGYIFLTLSQNGVLRDVLSVARRENNHKNSSQANYIG